MMMLSSGTVKANPTIDSLKKVLLVALDTQRVHVQLALSEVYQSLDPVEAMRYAQQAFEEADKHQYTLGLIRSINAKGVAHEYNGKNLLAIQLYREALKLSQDYRIRLGELESLGNIAIVNQYLGQLDSSIYYHKEALTLAYKLDNKQEIGDNLNNLGLLFELKGAYEDALVYLQSALTIYEQSNDLTGIAGTYNDIGGIQVKRGYFPDALEKHSKALKIAQKNNNESIIADTYNAIGSLYKVQKDWAKALRYYRNALALRKNNGEQTSYAASYNNIASVLIEMSKYDEAIHNLTKGQEFGKLYDNIEVEASISFHIAVSLQKQERYQEALQHLQKAYELDLTNSDPFFIVKIRHHLGEVYEALGQREKALTEMQEALKIARKINAKKLMRDAIESLAASYTKSKNYEKALSYHQELISLERELFGEEKGEALAQVSTVLKMQQKEKQLEIMQQEQDLQYKELAQQKWLFITLGVVFLLTVALLIVVLRSNRQNRLAREALASQKAEIQQQNQAILAQQNEIEQQNNLLATRYDELKELDTEKNYLIGVVAHDLQAPLNQIKGFLTILKYEKDRLPESAVQMHSMISQTANNMSDMIRKILDLKAIESKALNIKLEKYPLQDQLAEILEGFEVIATKKNIQLNIELPKTPILVQLDKNFAEQIFENLISNAIKFSPYEKEVMIKFETVSGKVRVHIQDQGPGISAEEQGMLFKKFQKLSAKPTGKESSTGLGLSIVKKYVEAMDGKVWYQDAETGADFVVEFTRIQQD